MNDRATIVIPLAEVRSKVKPRSAPKGRQVDPDAREMIAALLGGRDAVGHLRRDLLVEYLHLIQDRFGHLSAAHMAALAEAMKISQTEVYEVATFYHHFDVIKEGEAVPAALTVRVCETLSCSMAGSAALLEKLPAILGKEVRVIEAPCIGRCAEAPAVCVGQHAFGHATVESVAKAVCEQDTKPTAQQTTTHVGLKQYLAEGGYQTLLAVLSGKRDVEAVITEMEHSGLRGLGGAGFPTGRKWRIVRGETGPRLMAVNIDEGEPGTFKDRYYLERDPHRFIEGMLIAAQVVGIDASYVYLRDEYHHCRIIIEAEIAAAQAWASGKGITLPKIEIRRGAGAYICGEESAMIESIEGKRGMPRLRPPYVAQVGLFGRPTLEHNFETLYWVRDILEKGASWFSGHGRNGRKGLRSFSVSGRVKQPGVHLAPAGITVRELIDEYCGGMLDGHNFYAYLPGGASGGILPSSMGDIPLDFDTLQPHGCFIGSAAIVIMSKQDKARDAALNLMKFFADESCGQCTPCRVGTEKAVTLLEESKWKTGLLEELSQAMMDASICGLGQAAPNPIRCVIKHFSHEIE
ncbi:MAG: NAD(P)H-dependent oxidoreductase subunit E [Rhodocyclaceae bacterium]|nr:NAD(P)H-dependent oxidoreductase subunit E [Rhodocyclaceae bacterium]MCA3042129.1 NAD(P)H-dependent oxidoreductase subunit E [Rhodocyclaceae bacterium]MCA3054617.1 NAD(P)H-dependent oxidoreductase subunit E [Rhodocyclaceae bacterium]MCA3061463.1 NAD(P)H-dependent oxidoreductase subunit E [Rhodocyclaceae bacterium]MCA3084453.1 NAD(P)H-dependent oxidoreductase subunit E [Rhodocyclaceae bacterium]